MPWKISNDGYKFHKKVAIFDAFLFDDRSILINFFFKILPAYKNFMCEPTLFRFQEMCRDIWINWFYNELGRISDYDSESQNIYIDL